MNSPKPRIVYNEECIDLRVGNFQPVMQGAKSKKNQHQKPHGRREKSPKRTANDNNESVNTALKKLAKSYNINISPNEKKVRARVREYSFNEPFRKKFSGANSLKSRSELATNMSQKEISQAKNTSSPIIRSSGLQGDILDKVEMFQNKFTMTKEKNDPKKLIQDPSLQNLINKLIDEKPSFSTVKPSKYPLWKDHRLMEKYSLLKVPWKRSHTLPVYTPDASSASKENFLKKLDVYSDKKTYLYDDGSDIDSMFYKESHPIQPFFGSTLQLQMLTLLNISAYICALCVLSLIVWLVSNNKVLYNLLISKPPEHPVKRSLKYIGGGVIYTISRVLRLIGKIFSIPTQHVYQPSNEYWPPLD